MDYITPDHLFVEFQPGTNSSSPPICTAPLYIIDDDVYESLEQFNAAFIVSDTPVQFAEPSSVIVNITRDPDDGNEISFSPFLPLLP